MCFVGRGSEKGALCQSRTSEIWVHFKTEERVNIGFYQSEPPEMLPFFLPFFLAPKVVQNCLEIGGMK